MDINMEHNIIFTYDDEDEEWRRIEAAAAHLGLTIEDFVDHAIWLGVAQVYDEEAQKAYMRAHRVLRREEEKADVSDEESGTTASQDQPGSGESTS